MTRLDLEDIFHVHTIYLHLLLYTSEKQGQVTWNYWLTLSCKTSWRQHKELEQRPRDIVCLAILVVSYRMNSKPQSSFQCSISLGTCFFPSTCQCMKNAGLSSACTKKTWQLEACWNRQTMRGAQRPSKYQHHGTGSDACVHKCQQQLWEDCKILYPKLNNSSSGEHLCFLNMSWVF